MYVFVRVYPLHKILKVFSESLNAFRHRQGQGYSISKEGYYPKENEHKMPSFVPIAHRVYLRVTQYVCLKSPSAPRKGNLYAKLCN